MRQKFALFVLLLFLVQNAFSLRIMVICFNRLVILTETVSTNNASDYTWNLGSAKLTAGGGITKAPDKSEVNSLEFAAPGNYLITCKIDYTTGATKMDSFLIVAFEYRIPKFDIRDTTICGAVNLNLGTNIANPNYRYIWTPTGGTAQNAAITTAGNYRHTIYSVDLYSYSPGCSGCLACDSVWDDFNVKQGAAATVDLGPDRIICNDQTNILDAGAGYTDYTWTPNGEKTQTLQIFGTGLYGVTAVNSDGCKATDQVFLKDSCPMYIWIPNAFTPGDNGINDVFNWKGTLTTKKYTMLIFNRWGEKLYETSDANKGWDGKFKSKFVQEGVYAYYIFCVDTEGRKREYKGNVTVLYN